VVEEAAAVVSGGASVVKTMALEDDLVDLLVVLMVDCAIGVDFDEVVLSATPGLAVGIVTESAIVGWAVC